jgi:uncharacterized protein
MEDHPVNQGQGVLDRRRFLMRGASLLLGGLLGANFRGRVEAYAGVGVPGTPILHPGRGPLGPRIAIIIDDLGHNVGRSRKFLDLEMPLTFSILPQLPYTSLIAHEIHARGQEIMLHQPMEPYRQDLDPGPGALYISSHPCEIQKIIERNLCELPFTGGVNNHMGSRFTCSPQKVDLALRVFKERGLFFIDSVTSSRSIAFETARRLHMKTAFRNYFLDTCPEEEKIFRQLENLERHAAVHGAGIGIGHPYEVTLKALARYRREREGGKKVSLVHVSDLPCVS